MNMEGEPKQTYKEHPMEDAFLFTVDHIKVVDCWTGRNYLVVTTTPKADPVFEGDDVYKFNVSHVSQILSTGTVPDIRYKNSRS